MPAGKLAESWRKGPQLPSMWKAACGGALLHDLLLKVSLERCAILGRCHLPLKERGDLADAILIRLFIGGLCLGFLFAISSGKSHMSRAWAIFSSRDSSCKRSFALSFGVHAVFSYAFPLSFLAAGLQCRKAALPWDGIAVLQPQFACCCSFRQDSFSSPGCRDGIGLWGPFSPELGKCP